MTIAVDIESSQSSIIKFRKIDDSRWKEYEFYNNNDTNGAEKVEEGREQQQNYDLDCCHPDGDEVGGEETEPFTFDLFGRSADDDDDDDEEEDNMLYFTFRGTFVQRGRRRQLKQDDVGPRELAAETFHLLALTVSGESLCGHTRVLKSTGLAVWTSEDLARYFIKQQQQLLHGSSGATAQKNNLLPLGVRDKTVWELGAGTGIFGMVAVSLGARQVVLTDGDSDALNNLRDNIERNMDACLGIVDGGDDGECDGRNKTGTQTDKVVHDSCDGDNNDNREDLDSIVHCPQLVWGDVDAARNLMECYGRPDVLVACDVIYMTSSLDPFWETVSVLLSQSNKDLSSRSSTTTSDFDEKEDGRDSDTSNSSSSSSSSSTTSSTTTPLLFFMNTCPSNVTYPEIKECAERHGLEEVDRNENNRSENHADQSPHLLPFPHLHIFRMKTTSRGK